MRNLHSENEPRNLAASAGERLSDHLRWGSLPWPVRHLVRRHGLPCATAAAIAELIGYTMDGACQ